MVGGIGACGDGGVGGAAVADGGGGGQLKIAYANARYSVTPLTCARLPTHETTDAADLL